MIVYVSIQHEVLGFHCLEVFWKWEWEFPYRQSLHVPSVMPLAIKEGILIKNIKSGCLKEKVHVKFIYSN